MIRLRPWRVLAIGILGAATSLAAQQATPTFRAAVDLVTVDVRVLDKTGRPVPGLTADDFIVTLDGKPSPVRVIDYLSFPTRNVVNMPAPPTPTTGTAVRAGRSIIFGIDDRSIRVDDMPPFAEVISRAIALLGDDDLAGLIVPNGPSVAATRDRAPLMKAVRSLTGRRVITYVPVYVGIEEARNYAASKNEGVFTSVVQRECGETSGSEQEACYNTVRGQIFSEGASYEREVALQIDGLYDMIEAARALPPPRILVLCSNGNATWTDKLLDVKPVAEMALRADVQIEFLMQPPPNLDSSSQVRTQFARSRAAPSIQLLRDEDEKFLRRGGENVAEMLGAPIHKFTIGSDPALQELLIGWSGSYRLGLQAPENAGLSRLVPLKVRVGQPGATVYANRQALLSAGAMAAADARSFGTAGGRGTPPPDAPATPESRLVAAVAAGAESGVPVALGAAARRDEAGRDVQIVTMQIPKDVPGPIETMFGVLDESGKVIQRGAPQLAAGADGVYRGIFAVPLPPGHYRLRAAGIDAAGSLGVGEIVVDVKPTVAGGLAISDILFMWRDADGRAQMSTAEVQPASAESMQASLEFYPASPGGAVPTPTVTFTLLRAAGGAPLGEWSPVPRMSLQGAQAAVALPWDTLTAGRYTVRATVVVGTNPPVTITRSITKGS